MQPAVKSEHHGRYLRFPKDVLLQSGLADAEDEEDFDVKLDSLKSVWEKKALGFHDWFSRNRSQHFKESLVMFSRKASVSKDASIQTGWN